LQGRLANLQGEVAAADLTVGQGKVFSCAFPVAGPETGFSLGQIDGCQSVTGLYQQKVEFGEFCLAEPGAVQGVADGQGIGPAPLIQGPTKGGQGFGFSENSSKKTHEYDLKLL
jgi:hypothetical protein